MLEDGKEKKVTEQYVVSDRTDDDKWFISKVGFITLDEKTAKEKKQTFRYLVQAATSELALDYIKEMFSHGMSDYSIDSVQDTQTLDVFLTDALNNK